RPRRSVPSICSVPHSLLKRFGIADDMTCRYRELPADALRREVQLARPVQRAGNELGHHAVAEAFAPLVGTRSVVFAPLEPDRAIREQAPCDDDPPSVRR